MKIRRYKKVNKNINFYVNNFGFRQPYQILIDGTFCYAALNNQVNISDDIRPYLQGDVKLLTTQCAIIEMERLGHKLQGALLILKKHTVHRCGHEASAIGGSRCLLSMVQTDNNAGHYIIGTQDRDLQTKVRSMSGVPLLYLHSKTPVLEQPSPASVACAKDRLLGLDSASAQTIEELKVRHGLADSAVISRRKRRKGANPLSCMKKKKKNNNNVIKSSAVEDNERGDLEEKITRKKQRKRIRIPEHVKQELLCIKVEMQEK